MSEANTLIQVSPKEFTRRRYQSLGGNLYKSASGEFWGRRHGGTRGMWKLNARTERLARVELAKREADHHLVREGLLNPEKDPYSKVAGKLTIAELAQHYLGAGCPKRNRQIREGKQLAEEKRRVANLVAYFGKGEWDKLTSEDVDRYHRTRCDAIKLVRAASSGDRAVELELDTLFALYRHAIRNKTRTGVDNNPLPRIRFRDRDRVRHCRDCMPESAEELHLIASYLFQDPKSQSLGWLMLLQAMIGHRVGTMVQLRWDAARPRDPGFIERSEKGIPKLLYLVRSAGHKGAYGHIEVHPALRRALDALQDWRAERYPKSPWFFPSHVDEGQSCVDPSSLSKALQRVCRQLGIPHRTSHGMRSYFVNVLRSDRDADGIPKMPDSEIALRIGHKSGGKLIVQVYGEVLPTKLTWLPSQKESCAWQTFRSSSSQLQLEFEL